MKYKWIRENTITYNKGVKYIINKGEIINKNHFLWGNIKNLLLHMSGPYIEII